MAARNLQYQFYHCSFLWKDKKKYELPKKVNALLVRSRPIASNIGNQTGQIPHFLHFQLRDAILSHEFV